MRNKSINGIHAQRLKDIRSFVDFDYDLRQPLTRYQKAKIKRYYDEIDSLTAVPHQTYRPRTKKHLKAAQRFSGQQSELRGLKVAFVPNNGKRVKIQFDQSGEMRVKSKHVETSFIEFDELALIDNPTEYTKQLLENRTEKQFTVSVGDGREIPKAYTKNTLPEYIGFLTTKYGSQLTDDRNDAEDILEQLENDEIAENEREELKRELPNNHYLNWLSGINAHAFTNQDNFDDYFVAKQNAKEALQKKRKAKKKAIKRKYKK